MPAWNSAAFIAPVLESLAAQTYPNLEVVISVDASSDGTAEICEAFAAAHPNVRVHHQPVRRGWVANANAVLAAAAGDYRFFAFHDDPLRPHYVERLLDALQTDPSAVLAYADVESNLGTLRYRELEGIDDRYERVRRVLTQRGDWWVPNRGLMRAEAVRELGGLRRHRAGEYSADLPWLVRLAMLGGFVRVPEVLLTKNFRGDSLSASWRKSTSNRFAVTLACLEAVRRGGFSARENAQLHLAAARSLAATEAWFLNQRLRRV